MYSVHRIGECIHVYAYGLFSSYLCLSSVVVVSVCVCMCVCVFIHNGVVRHAYISMYIRIHDMSVVVGALFLSILLSQSQIEME